uniref:Uncharacterized protein n=1 Tax=Arundo donax TaxID=35708 RepID=A0A0A9H4W0_ARUDO
MVGSPLRNLYSKDHIVWNSLQLQSYVELGSFCVDRLES